MNGCPRDAADATSPGFGSWLYLLERFDVGMIYLDADLTVVGMNEFARRTLPVERMEPFGKIVTSFHPESARSKVQFLLDQVKCPVSNPPPMTMIINIPERVLLIKVGKIEDLAGAIKGYNLVFYDITEVVSTGAQNSQPEAKRRLLKIPTVRQNRIVLLDVQSVSHIRSEGHYTWVQTPEGSHFCNLTIGDLESRLSPDDFLRVHRSYIINLHKTDQILRDDGRVTLQMADPAEMQIPVARSSVAKLMQTLGLSETAVWR